MNMRLRMYLRLTHSASELLGFTCTSSLTMNEKFHHRTRPPSECSIDNFEFIVSERVQVNPTLPEVFSLASGEERQSRLRGSAGQFCRPNEQKTSGTQGR